MKNLLARIRYTTALLFVQLLVAPAMAAGPAKAGKNPDFTKGEKIPAGATHDWNLGPTGARGWMFSQDMMTSTARQVAITKVASGSPAFGALTPGDVILGVGNYPFASDPRVELGKAITAAEATDGKLALSVWRQGETRAEVLRLPVIGSYSDTSPFDCRKSIRIFEAGCEALAAEMQKGARYNQIERSLNALALLSSGDRKYLPLVRKQAQVLSKYSDPKRTSFHSWWYGYLNVFLAEYVLATGDQSLMPDLRRVTMEIVHGQSAVGSWGHKFVEPEVGQLTGYGMMNSPGIPLTISLVLARRAGVSDPALDKAIEKSARLLRFYVNKGSIPYGDHDPWLKTHDDNGKNGMAAVLFDLLGDKEAAEYFSRMSVASYGAERDAGHTGNFFNMTWAMPGVCVSGPHATGVWMEEFGWYFDLSRGWDLSFTHQGPPANAPDSYDGWDCTGAYLLAYGMPLKKIYLAGKAGRVAPQVNEEAAQSLIADGRGWNPKSNAASYANRSDTEILAGLSSWSPVVRERSAAQLPKRKSDPVPALLAMLEDGSPSVRYGACRGLQALGGRAAPAALKLKDLLDSDDVWLRVQAAEALSRIGTPANFALPRLLEMLGEVDPQADPRGMQQRYLCLVLFKGGNSLLRRNLHGMEREVLYTAVRTGLNNENGFTRGRVATIYKSLTYEEIEPLLPAIVQAIAEPAPSGIMFADTSRLSGLEILAKHRIQEGVAMCIDLMEPERWGARRRIKACLAILRDYGGAAKPELPRLYAIQSELEKKNWKPKDFQNIKIAETIKAIESDKKPQKMRSLNSLLNQET